MTRPVQISKNKMGRTKKTPSRFPTRAEKMKITREKNICIAIEKCEMMKQYNIDITTVNKIFHMKNQKAKAEEMYNKLTSKIDLSLDDAGWIYCAHGGGENVYKCGYTEKGTREEAEKSLYKRFGVNNYYHYIYHMVPVSNAQMCEKILFGKLSEYRLERGEFFRVNDLATIILEMNKLPF